MIAGALLCKCSHLAKVLPLMHVSHLLIFIFFFSSYCLTLRSWQSNVCNQLPKETSEEPLLLKRSSSPSSPSSATAAFAVSALNSPRSVDETMMDKPSRSPSVASDLDDVETSSPKSNDKCNANSKADTKVDTCPAKAATESKEPEVSFCK